MPAPPAEPPSSGGIHVGDVRGDVEFRALGDIVGGDKVTTITTTIQISVEAVTQRPLITASPYRGLDRFEDRDAALFFGRDQFIKALLAQLSATNVLLVLGASGSGKSSVVRAGVLPRLSQLVGARFRYFTLVPDLNPFESLRSALQSGGFSQAQTRELLEAQPDAPIRLIRGLQREGDQWLIFVDQFEEIFTISDERLRKSFISALVKIAQDSTGSIKLVLAMRADFFDRFSPFPQFAKLVEKNIAFVTDMQVDELRLAIEQPAAKHGVVFEQGLVEEIIKDVKGQAGSLPLLQYTLSLCWLEEECGNGLADRHLNTQTYRELGGVRGALQKRADEIYASFGDGADPKSESAKQKVVRQIFLRVVDLAGQGADEGAWRPVGRRVPKAIFSSPQEQEILQALIDQKLLVSSGRQGAEATVEVAHEALFTSWGRLKGWIAGGKQVIFARNRLTDDARRWQTRRKEDEIGAEEELLSGSRLGQALEMRARGDFDTLVGGLSETETQFLDASAALRDRRRQEEQERLQRELAQAQALATEQKKRADDQAKAAARQRKLTMAMALVSLVAVLAGVFSWVQSRKTREAASRGYVSLALYSKESSKNAEALAQLAQALRLNPKNREAATMVASMLAQLSWHVLLTGSMQHHADIASAQFSPNGQRIVTISKDNTARLWDAGSGKPIGEPLKHEDSVNSAQFSPDNQRVVTVSAKTAQVWDAASGKKHGAPMKHDGRIISAQFSPDSQRVVTASEDKKARLWDATSGKLLAAPVKDERRFDSYIDSAQFSPDSQRIVTAVNKTAQVWDTTSGQPIGKPMEHESFYTSPQFSPDGQRVVTVSQDNMARVWDAASGQPLGEAMKHEGIVYSAQFSPDGQRVVTASLDNTARLWDTVSGKPLGKPLKHESLIVSAQFSPDGQRVVTVSADKTTRVWDAASGQPIGEPMEHEDIVISAQFSPDGQRVVTASADMTARVWDATRSKPIAEPIRYEGVLESAKVSPDGQRIVTASQDNMARVWDTGSGKPIGKPMEHGREVLFSPDSQRVVTCSDQTAHVWDATSGEPIGKPMKDLPPMHSVLFSPDSQRVVTCSNKTAQAWDAASGEPVGKPMEHESNVISAQFSPDGQRVLTASRDNTTSVWDVATGEPIGKPMKHEDVRSAQFSPDGHRILTSGDKTTQLWDAATGKPIGKPMGHEDSVESAQFSPDSQWVVTASMDKTARLWSATSGAPVGQPMRHEGIVFWAQFTPDSQRVLTTSQDNTARLWDAVIVTDKDTRADVLLLAELAEATGYLTLETVGQSENLKLLAPERARAVREKVDAKFLGPSSKLTPLQRVMKWSVSDRRDRTISPFSQVAVSTWMENKIKEGTIEGLRAALEVDPANARVTAHLGRRLADLAFKQGSDPDEESNC